MILILGYLFLGFCWVSYATNYIPKYQGLTHEVLQNGSMQTRNMKIGNMELGTQIRRTIRRD